MIEDRSRDYMNARRVAKVWNSIRPLTIMFVVSMLFTQELSLSGITLNIFNH